MYITTITIHVTEPGFEKKKWYQQCTNNDNLSDMFDSRIYLK